MLHERQIRTLQSLPRPVNVLTTHSAWLMSSLVLGCNGLLSGSGSVIPELQAALWQAVQANDLRREELTAVRALRGGLERVEVEPPVQLLEVAEVRGIQTLDDLRGHGRHGPEPGHDPGEQEHHEVRPVPGDPRIDERRELVPRRGQAHPAVAVDGAGCVDVAGRQADR